ncbi:MAG: hypothetical protein Q7S33_04000 [Nanoarchaeota archaeon]|nr:hypothetical protein [Nanoarchaeota archaeon]
MEFRDDYGQSYEVPRKSVVAIGRDPARCDLVVPPQDSLYGHYRDSKYNGVMPRHATFWPATKHIMVEEKNRKIDTLKSGDIVTLGKLNLTFIGD